MFGRIAEILSVLIKSVKLPQLFDLGHILICQGGLRLHCVDYVWDTQGKLMGI